MPGTKTNPPPEQGKPDDGVMPRCIAEFEGFGYSDEPLAFDVSKAPPAFFIVGAPRCGTTAVSKTLSRNPKISFSKPKETHYFLEPHPGMDDDAMRAQYLRRYHRGLTESQQAIGDGSVSYLYEPDAIRRCLTFDPRAKFIALVRNPVEMMRSYHSRMLFQLDEDVYDFDRAWSLQAARARGEQLPKRCRFPRLLQYAEIGSLGRQVERLFETAGRERCHVIVFDDFISDPRRVYLDTLGFVGVDDDGQATFRRRRESSGYRYEWLQQFVMNPPRWTYPLLRFSRTGMVRRIKKWRKHIKQFNTKETRERQVFTDASRAMLREYFAADVRRLGELIGRDLSAWSRAPDA